MEFDDLVSKVTAEYELFLFALTGRYLSAITPGAEVSPKTIISLQDDAYSFGRTYLDSVKAPLSDYLSRLGIELSPTDKGVLFDRLKTLMGELHRVVLANIKTASTRLKTGRPDIGKMIKEPHGAVGLLIQKRMESPDYKVEDTAARKWDSKNYVRFVVRDFAYKTELEAVMLGIQEKGQDLAQIQYDDANHANNGLVFSISGKDKKYPSLAEIGKKIFHPNATAKVKPYVPA